MAFELKLAVRYLASSRLQTALLVAGVAVGVLVFTFIAALMNGLGVRLTDDITGNAAHVTLAPEPRTPRSFLAPRRGRARALIMKPELVLADEPTGNLDRASSDHVMDLLRELSRDEDTALLISTHDESIAQRSDRILTMQDGQLIDPIPNEPSVGVAASARSPHGGPTMAAKVSV